MSRVGCDLRRVTMFVRNMDEFLKVYVDALGMKLHYDETMVLTGINLPAGVAGADNTVRLCMVKANDDYVGMIGALQYLDQPLPDINTERQLYAGDAVYLFNVSDVKAMHTKITNLGLRVMSGINEQIYPSPTGGDLVLKGFNFIDYNGYFVICNQWVKGNHMPANHPQDIACDLRRVTMLLNGDNTTQLKIYRDILGMKINYNDTFTQKDTTFPVSFDDSEYEINTTFLEANNSYIGALGLETFLAPTIQQKPFNERLGIGDHVFVFNVDNLNDIAEQIKQCHGVKIAADLHDNEYPNPNDANAPYRLRGFNFYDPAGFFIECNQWLK